MRGNHYKDDGSEMAHVLGKGKFLTYDFLTYKINSQVPYLQCYYKDPI